MIRALLIALVLTACAESHQRGDEEPMLDATIADADAGTLDAGGRDAGRRNDAGPGPRCGPNRCRGGEICCHEECGICAFEDECADIVCGVR
ncbi:hypothetical protein [Sandaracinus amylolyticus]|uniref:Uncharacterized protein n=1 Tax=Sandaracinus amylolyticus TaxID=927083 RepID=A0A0F6W9M6_9BACT|nr:hypothetical protein [Sandaracinus amylolyticus]AKF10923.1 hypothetical protein DB32_008072 [Sandaracinus amylolyticus]